ncbi:UDP-glucose 4-epimerase [Photobacterium marinum]|uniref:UDP-glucose 4-epimerase n=1 Tax=Photobacterium marinum TaxID=1056511 RepID=L8J8C7_9GAMM|nr:NAD(P)-dependent oxidoreductase [Photobacterium marinum]ELR65066.1 UDP-glucose 4-epimerase [Photobacterium marinum]
MNIAITGANGYIGRNVVRNLVESGHNVISLVHPNDEIHRFLDGSRVIKTDIFSLAAQDCIDIFSDVDCLLHLAWQAGFNHHDPSHIQNVVKHFNFIDHVTNSGVKNISVAGTMHEIGYYVGEIDANTPCNPSNPYGIAKNFLRQALITHSEKKHFNLQWLRFYYITGDDKHSNSIFGKILRAAEDGKSTFPLNSGEMLYDFIDINELSEKIKIRIESGVSGIFNCSSGKPKSLRTAVEQFIEKHKLTIKPEYNVFPAREYDSMAIWGKDY